ncbi:MAG: hypothetical protein CMQ41_11525 [Gammaproteobacteria bacterium]|nr:hypothetical protein [Gammaproteobacteria bacterium]|tara:strand:- start:1011 stop:1205 length:195 start_codon:yes stop_codon:yes gene_type:complete
MSKKSRNKAKQGTWALTITAGLIIGLGFGTLLENVLLLTIIGTGFGAGTSYYLTRRKNRISKKK